ncbi:MAG TPA: colicin E3 [Cyanobacteria bacterium UBA11369]|nr:colicin E3 [Cyanobacteria bacterium UBA11371]HBE31289.1 colicin E3 [Cyanobacteria bacterium UBA11368]HBE53294.1 colicin E3 [Cyanobacteria bacterium UBA11369]
MTYIQPPRSVLEGFPSAKLVKSKTPVQGGGGLRRRWETEEGHILEWDSRHGRLEKYDRLGNHLGEFCHLTGNQIKPRDHKRKLK